MIGLFFAGLANLQYHDIANINLNKAQQVFEDVITTPSNAIIKKVPGISRISSGHYHAAPTASLAITSCGIPLTGNMSAMGFIIFILICYGVVIFTVHIIIIIIIVL
jgi:hypothetical protein